MAQTARPFAELETLFADGVSKAITALRLRDFLESALGCYGSMYVEGGSTAEGLTITPQKLTGWTSAGVQRNVLADVGNDRLIINATGIYMVSLGMSFETIAALDTYEVDARINEVKAPGLSSGFGPIPPGTIVPASFGRPLELVQNDYLEIWGWSTGGVGDIKIQHAQLSVDRVG
jgi:hypothetical protein